KTVLVESLSEFSSLNPLQEYSFRIIEDLKLNKETKLEQNSIIKGRVLRFVAPKRLQKDAYFVFVPYTYTIPSYGNQEFAVTKRFETKIKYYEDFQVPDSKTVAKNTGLFVVGCMIPGLDYVINFADGMTHPKDGKGRFKSGCSQIVESWPICYCLKGDEIVIQRGAKAKFTFDKEVFVNE
ncbi:MAG: hypothetical protein PHE78_08470, partial [Candidatus Gastranaerophilales bacterium]|nr:hypothetical protein [Candidatus Gastranaerophilales bacterium]